MAGMGGIQGFPARVSSAQITAAMMISARISVFAAATAAAARVSMACTNPGEGFAPDSDSISSA